MSIRAVILPALFAPLLWVAPIYAAISWAAISSAATSPANFDHAERLRDALEAKPEPQRTRAEYNKVLDAFRAIYHGDPASPRADASISAVAGLLAEEGRVFHDAKALNDAISEYEFLRREYPGSRYRFSGVLAEGEIYRHDLGDREAARSAFQNFLKLYPSNPMAGQARQELALIDAEEQAEKHSARKKSRTPARTVLPKPTASAPGFAAANPPPAERATAERGAKLPRAGQPSTPASSNARDSKTIPSSTIPSEAIASPTIASGNAGAAPNASRTASTPAPDSESSPVSRPLPAPAANTPSRANTSSRRGRPILVTGVRHWSTPVYTRVAIDLQDEVQYEAARVPDPDRIFFDLHGARLSPELIGKSVQVTDDGFLKRIRVAQSSGDVARIVLDVSDVSDYSAFMLPNPYRLIIDIHGRKGGAGGAPAAASSTPPLTRSLKPNAAPQASTSQTASAQSNRRAANPPAPPAMAAFSMQDVAGLDRQPNRIRATRGPTTAPIAASVAGTTPAPQPNAATTMTPALPSTSRSSRTGELASRPAPNAAAPAIHEAEPTADGARSLSRALGLKIGRIVVDAGHGGHDSGTLGPDGVKEKDVVLDVSLRLGKLLKKRLGADVIFTRDDDTFIPLETRTAIANKAQADLFISVHANSSPDPEARGVETYYLSFTSSADALEVAARENAVSQQSIHQLADLVRKIAMQDKIDESREFAADVECSLYTGLTVGQSQNVGLKDRGVKKAPFVVLIGANMPSILAEISFLTNPQDEGQLRDQAYRQRIAESLYLGIARYIGGLSGVRLANNAAGH